jgi:hypothetical protein
LILNSVCTFWIRFEYFEFWEIAFEFEATKFDYFFDFLCQIWFFEWFPRNLKS